MFDYKSLVNELRYLAFISIEKQILVDFERKTNTKYIIEKFAMKKRRLEFMSKCCGDEQTFSEYNLNSSK